MNLNKKELSYWKQALENEVKLIETLPYLSNENKKIIENLNCFMKEMGLFFEYRESIKEDLSFEDQRKKEEECLAFELTFKGEEPIRFWVGFSKSAFRMDAEKIFSRYIEDYEFRKKILEEKKIETGMKMKNIFEKREDGLTELESEIFYDLEQKANEQAEQFSMNMVDELAEAFVSICKKRANEQEDLKGIELKPLTIK